ncbi:MAG: hypothetical protein IJU98_07835 [Synergistaceae bacterium]|nr:hypothetical protein [Synergistaceae bacterium]
MKTIIETILAGGFVEFSCHGGTYLIQREHNKGCYYLSLWRLTPDASCMFRVCFDDYDGVSDETVRELLDQPLSKGRTVRNELQNPETVTVLR